jgi:DNA-binding FadR family transcriptional regulator
VVQQLVRGRISAVDDVTDRIAFDIVSGVHAAGDTLPSVRALAAKYDINPSTVQIVTSRLRDAGFVQPSQGAFIVRDIELCGGIETWHYLFRFAQRMPDRATKLFESLLSTRRVLLLEVLRTISKDPSGIDLRAFRRAIERLDVLARGEPPAPPEPFARAELQVARIMLHLADQQVLLALYNTIAEIFMAVPAVLEAMYAEPAFNASMWRALVDGWERGAVQESELAAGSTALAAFHVTCVKRFRRLLE